MSGSKSKNKGSSYERKIAKKLSKWCGMDLRRTPLSGGWARQNPKASGDVTSISDGEFPLHIECKKNESFQWEAALHGKGVINDWWEQTINTCPKNKIPMLVFSKAYMDDWVMMKYSDWDVLDINSLNTLETLLIITQSRVIILLSELLDQFKIEDFALKVDIDARTIIQQR